MKDGADTGCEFNVREAVNFNERCDGIIDMLIMHYTGMPDGEQALNWLCVEESQVSCHYLVHEDGSIVQMVKESKRAWHAGKSSWMGHSDINSRSIGIEIVNPGHDHGYPEFPVVQIEAVIELSKDIIIRNDIPAQNVLAHSDIASMRKQDPGEKFPWELLHEHGIGHWVSPSAISDGRFFQLGDLGGPISALQSMLASYGYGIEASGEFDENTQAVVRAFQSHFRQYEIDGIADASTVETLYRLISSLPDTPSVK